ncbi:hypothetical protein ACHAXA_002338 [Cyclostephanos tholiformis]|uniref:Uncharacterized protein n=1 Tax=Cyclostephanos tholiformis TaxID=382380 RepID=A0ABD3SS58_9STRA
MPSQGQSSADASGGGSNGFDDTTLNAAGDGGGGVGRKHPPPSPPSASSASTSESESNDDLNNRPEKKRGRSDRSISSTANDVDVEVDDPCRDYVAMTNQRLIESIARREALRHVEMAWRAQQRLVRRCLGLRFLGDAQSVAILDRLRAAAAEGEESHAAGEPDDR